jgi:hypothetical protein
MCSRALLSNTAKNDMDWIKKCEMNVNASILRDYTQQNPPSGTDVARRVLFVAGSN